MDEANLSRRRFHLFADTNASVSRRWFYLHKSNAANERLAD